ncbi:hypothetical protein FGIG_10564 [Fasciola gigantica]|uniref:Uncharacterized protein n=1 Tax=Fasciola gigantica TaxID=46835 RepID=A0A504YDQ5_FASGI|nr:hypothetical protein FGIG_10564 [Fasciola gigantica]
MTKARRDYIDEVDTILTDSTKFTGSKEEEDRTQTAEEQLTAAQNYISNGNCEQLRPAGTSIPRLYDLPKIHKSGVPLRLILGTGISPTTLLLVVSPIYWIQYAEALLGTA